MSDGPPAKRLRLTKEQLIDMGKSEIIEHLLAQDSYLDVLEAKAVDGQNDNFELACLRESEEKMKQQQLEATRRENVLVMRLTTKEQEMQDYANQIQELKQAQIPGISQLRSTLLDPAVNLMFERMKKELDATKAKLEETQNDLSAWKFTPDSNTGKRLMAKCRLLHQENEELGKIISSGRVAKLEADLALQRNFSEEMKLSQTELDEFLTEFEQDVEGMQTTICQLQQQLRDAKDSILKLQQDNQKLQSSQDASSKPSEIHLSAAEQLTTTIKSEILSNSSNQLSPDVNDNRTLDDEIRTVVKEEVNSNSNTSTFSSTDHQNHHHQNKEPINNESPIHYNDGASDYKLEATTSNTELGNKIIRTPPSYSTSNSTLIISVNEDETSLDVDDKPLDDTNETNGDPIASPYTSEASRSPYTPVIKSPLCKENSNGETLDGGNVSDVDSNSMDTCSRNCENTVRTDDSTVRHWSSVNGVTHSPKSDD